MPLRWSQTSFLLLLVGLCLLVPGCAGVSAPLKLEDSVISDRQVWSGEVRVRGVVTVKKSGHLTIQPGTRVVFMPLDRDGDGIGDSELFVEGGLVAKGTARSPILFTSGAEHPQSADWKYVYLDFAREAVLDHVVAEYAYSGLQVHFCKARVTNSEFRLNVDGLRFSTVNIEVAGNHMHDNVHGIRYEERRSEARLHHNNIHDNDIGLFVVTRSDDRAVIEMNNITGNRLYDVKLGLEQPGDVTLPNNWWGTTDVEEIETRFFDQKMDASLGRVRAPDPLSAPVDPSVWLNQ